MIPTEYFQVFIYCMFFFAMVIYATLDGFDLGVGNLHFFAKGDLERRLMINAARPVWDGNTTWLVIGSGILFAAFPKVFTHLSTSLYTPIMILFFGYILRGASIEFRSKRIDPTWRKLWDILFFFSSFLLAAMLGLLLGNLIRGLPLTHQGEYLGSFWTLFTPYSLLISLFGVSTFSMHGSIYMLMKTEHEFHDKMGRWAKRLIFLFLIFWVLATLTTLFLYPKMLQPFFSYPFLFFFPLLSLGSIAKMMLSIQKKRDKLAFAYSCFTIVFLMILFFIGIFPDIVPSTISPETHSLTLYNSSASRIALIVISIAVISMLPLSFFYGSYIRRVFKGKVKIDPMHY